MCYPIGARLAQRRILALDTLYHHLFSTPGRDATTIKLKGVGPLEYHLGCTYKKDPDGTLAADPRRYVNKILESYERMFKEKPR